MIATEPEFEARNRLLALIDDLDGNVPCATTDPELWFPESSGYNPKVVEMCRACPIARECAEFALWHFQEFGLWGGTNPNERKATRVRLGIRRRPDSRQTLEEFLEHSQ